MKGKSKGKRSWLGSFVQNAWTVTILGGVVGTVISGVILYLLFQYSVEVKEENLVDSQVSVADSLLEYGQPEFALRLYQDLLSRVSPKDDGGQYSHLKYQEGRCYTDLAAKEDEENNLRLAVRAFKEAESFSDSTRHSREFACIQSHLAGAYSDLSLIRDQKKSLERARNHVQLALRFLTDEADKEYAIAKRTLGNVLADLCEFEEGRHKRQMLDSAAACLAVAIRLARVSDDDSAASLTSLAYTYFKLSYIRDGEANLHMSVKCCDNALRVYSVDRSPDDYAIVNVNLGNAYCGLAAFGDAKSRLWKSIECYESALSALDTEKEPRVYGIALLDLGAAYIDLSRIESKTEHLREALASLTESLKYLSVRSYPIFHAKVRWNLGIVYQELAESAERRENLLQALRAYDEALKVYSVEAYPSDRKLVSTLRLQVTESLQGKQ
jgi:tetratricopeptide (TPR) repeat protein